MRDLTLVMPHYCNLGMWDEHQRVWADYPDEIRARLHVVLVDDCSPKGCRLSPKSVSVTGLGSLRMYRLLQKVRWNWLACRNLGAKMTSTEWMLLTDIDHVIPVETMTRLTSEPLESRAVYRFRRVTAVQTWPYALTDCTDYKPHNDSFLLTRRLFFDDRVGGYDERLSGCYGTSGEFRDRLVHAASAHVIRLEKIIRYPREIISDASTPPTVYTRKGDPQNDEELRAKKEARALIPNWKPLHGLIPYEEVYASTVVAA
jgi:hypothetical protein